MSGHLIKKNILTRYIIMGRSHSRSPSRRERRRSRSRSWDREADRERDRERGRDRDRTRDRRPKERERYRSRSPYRRHSRSPRRRSRSLSRSPRRRSPQSSGTKAQEQGAVPNFLLERPAVTEKDLEGKTEEEKEMMKMMGFGNFDSTKGKHVPGNNLYFVHLIQKRKYRQYMNRKGGFNRPLDFVA